MVRVAGASVGKASRYNVKSVERVVDGLVSICVESKNLTLKSGPSGLRWSMIYCIGRKSSEACSSCSMTDRRMSKKLISGVRSSLRSKGCSVFCADVQITKEGSGVYRNSKVMKDVRSRW